MMERFVLLIVIEREICVVDVIEREICVVDCDWRSRERKACLSLGKFRT